MNRADHVIAAVAGALALAVIAVLMWQDGRDNYRVMLSAQACVALDPISAPLMPAPGGGCALKGNSGPDGLTGGYYLRVYTGQGRVAMDFSEGSVVSGYETGHQILSLWTGVLLSIGVGMLALWLISLAPGVPDPGSYERSQCRAFWLNRDHLTSSPA